MRTPGSGILCVEKPPGWTSFDVIRFAKKRWNTKRVGHTGTLDPMAEGVLVLCFGQATKLSDIFLKLPKTYQATIKFGLTTNTDDITGEPMSERDPSGLREDDILKSAEAFRGRIMQTPPQFSAIKIDGEPAYKSARRGEKLQLRQREVTIYGLKIVDFNMPEISLEVRCSSGTYIRSIARDWGENLGVGGTLTKLKRTSVGHLSLDNCHPISQLQDCDSPPFLDFDYATSFLGKIAVDDEIAGRVRNGIAPENLGFANGDLHETDGNVPGEAGDTLMSELRGSRDLFLLVNNGSPLALLERSEGSDKGCRYLRVFPEWK